MVLRLYHKMAIIETSFMTNHVIIFLLDISIIINMIFPFCPLLFNFPFFLFALINHSMFVCCNRQVFLIFSGQTNIGCTGYSVHNHLCVRNFSPGIFTVDINWKRNIFSMVLRPSATSLPCTGALIPRSIITVKSCDKIGIRYNAVENL